MNIPGSRLCFPVLTSRPLQLLSASLPCSPSLECQPMSTRIVGLSFMSRELQIFLRDQGVATSRTTSYNPEGNGQVEGYNGVIWKALTMCLKSKNLPVTRWQDVLPDVLHSARSLLCTATNETPHERFFGFPRRSSSGASIPTWLATPGPVLLKRQVRPSKTDPLVDEVELLAANSNYAHVRYPDGREGLCQLSILHLKVSQ